MQASAKVTTKCEYEITGDLSNDVISSDNVRCYAMQITASQFLDKRVARGCNCECSTYHAIIS